MLAMVTKVKNELRHGWRILKEMATFFKFTIRNPSYINLLHPQPSLFLFGLLLPLWCFSTLVSYYFEAFLHFTKMT